jgi:hypothetical protein
VHRLIELPILAAAAAASIKRKPAKHFFYLIQ